MAADDEVTIKVAADIAAAVAALGELTQNLSKMVASVAAIAAQSTASSQATQQFLENFVKGALESANAAGVLGDKSGEAFEKVEQGADAVATTTAALGDLNKAAADNGISLEGLGLAMGEFSERLTAGDAALTASLLNIGLRVETLKTLAPEEQFAAIVDAIKQMVPAADQSAAAVAIFGQNFASSANAILNGPAPALTDAFDALVAGSTEAAEGIGQLPPAVEKVTPPVERAKTVWEEFVEAWTGGTDKSKVATVAWGVEISKGLTQITQGIKDTITAFPNMIAESANFGDELLTLSQRIDVSVVALQELRYISSQSGAPLEALGRVIFDTGNKLTNTTERFREAVTRIGQTVEGLKTMKREDAFFAMLQSLKATVPASEQAAVGMELFGGRFRSVSQLLHEDIDKTRAKYKELGLALGPEFFTEADRFNDALDDIAKKQEHFKNSIAEYMLGPLADLLEEFPKVGGGLLTLGSSVIKFGDSFSGLATTIGTMQSSGLIKWLGNTTLALKAVTAAQWAWNIAIGATEVVMLPMLLAAGAVLAYLAAAYTAYRILAEVVQLYWEDQERANAAQKQAVVDGSNLIILNKSMKTSYTDLAEAVAEYNRRLAEKPPVSGADAFAAALKQARADVKELTAARKAEILEAQKYGQTVEQITTNFKLSELAQKVLTETTKEYEEATKKAAAAAKAAFERSPMGRFSEGLKALVVDMNAASAAGVGARTMLAEFGQKASEVAANAARVPKALAMLPAAVQAMAAAFNTKHFIEELDKVHAKVLELTETMNFTPDLSPAEQAFGEHLARVSAMRAANFAEELTGNAKTAALRERAEEQEIALALRRAKAGKYSAEFEVQLIRKKYVDLRAQDLKYTGDLAKDMAARGVKKQADLALELAVEQAHLADLLRDAKAHRAEQTKDERAYTKFVIEEQRKRVAAAKAAATGTPIPEDWTVRAQKFSKGLGDITQAFAQLAEITGKNGDVFARMSATLNIATQAGAQFHGSLEAFKTGDWTSGILGMVSALGALKSAMFQANDQAKGFDRVMSNTMSGASFGAQVGGPIGAIWGAAAGFLRGAFSEDPEWATIMNESGERWGHHISEGLARAIAADADKMFGGIERAAEAYHLGDIIAEAGGITKDNDFEMAARLVDVFEYLEEGIFSTAEATKVLEESFQAFYEAGVDSAGYWNGSLKTFVAGARAAGIEIQAVTDAVNAEVAAVQNSANAIINASKKQFDGWQKIADKIKDAKKEIEELNKEAERGRGADWAAKMKEATDKLAEGMKEQTDASGDFTAEINAAKKAIEELNQVAERGRGVEWTAKMKAATETLTASLEKQKTATGTAADELENLGFIAVNAYAVAISQGLSHAEALKAAGPGLTQLQTAYENLGLKVEDAGLKSLLMQNSLSQKTPELIAGIDGLAGSFKAMANLGLMNAETFSQFQEAGARMYARIKKEVEELGGSERDALIPMAGYLRAAEKEALRTGVALDANTQSMLDQAKAQGVLGEDAMGTNEILIEGISALITALGGELPSAWETAATKARKAAEDMRNSASIAKPPVLTPEARDAQGDGERPPGELAPPPPPRERNEVPDDTPSTTGIDTYITRVGEAQTAIDGLTWDDFVDRSGIAAGEVKDDVLDLSGSIKGNTNGSLEDVQWAEFAAAAKAAGIEIKDAFGAVATDGVGVLTDEILSVEDANTDAQLKAKAAAMAIAAEFSETAVEGVVALSDSILGIGDAGDESAGAVEDAAEAIADAYGETAEDVEAAIAGAVEDSQVALEEMPWDDFAEGAIDASDDSSEAVDGLNDTFVDVADQLNDTDWTSWSDALVAAAQRAQRAITGVSLGTSPGGLKEIPLKINDAIKSFSAFKKSGVDAASSVQRYVDALHGSTGGVVMAGGITTEQQANDKREAERTAALTGLVTDMKAIAAKPSTVIQAGAFAPHLHAYAIADQVAIEKTLTSAMMKHIVGNGKLLGDFENIVRRVQR